MRISDWSSDVCSSDRHIPQKIPCQRRTQRPRGTTPLTPSHYEIASSGKHAHSSSRFRIFSRILIWLVGRGRGDLEVTEQEGRRPEVRRVGKECVSQCRSRL